MTRAAPITGYVDGSGRLLCTVCCDDMRKSHHETMTVYGDNSAFDGQSCEVCGWVFPFIRTREYVQVAHGYPTPELRHNKEQYAKELADAVQTTCATPEEARCKFKELWSRRYV